MANDWTDTEIVILSREYPERGTDIPQLLQRHTQDSIFSKASALGLKVLNRINPRSRKCLYADKWYNTVKEACKAADTAYTGYLRYCSKKNLDATVSLDGYVAQKSDNWSAAEDAILREYYYKEGRKVAARLPGRSEAGVASRAKHLGLASDRAPVHWTKEEEEIIRSMGSAPLENVLAQLPGRTMDALRVHRIVLGLAESVNVWSADEDDAIWRLYTSDFNALCEALPDRSPMAIYSRASKLFSAVLTHRHSVDGGSFILGICPVCGATVLVPASLLRSFKHGPMCKQYLWEEA